MGELYHQMVRSSAFDGDRLDWQNKWYQAPTSATWEAMSAELKQRKQAQKPHADQ